MMNIGFISTRLAGTDGVSLETNKLAKVLREQGHKIFYCAGELDGTTPGLEVEGLHFTTPTAQTLMHQAFDAHRTAEVTALDDALNDHAEQLKPYILHFFEEFEIDYVIVQNAFSIPMQLPLGKAIADALQEAGMPALAHNHDYYWERPRYLNNVIPDFLDRYFPPDLPNLQHACINSIAQKTLKERRGLDSILIPNVFDFATPPPQIDAYSADFRQAIGLTDEDWLILQPTRVVPRKGIELAIEALGRLADSRAKLVITHKAGDEGMDYLYKLQALAKERGVALRYVADMVDELRGQTADGHKIYALWDTYPHADFVMYPSLIEGFGNALIETVYFGLPALVNRYPVYVTDIAPKGFQFIEIDGEISDEADAGIRHLLTDKTTAHQMTHYNFELGKQHYSYQALAAILEPLLPHE